jgi:hypothetical protein
MQLLPASDVHEFEPLVGDRRDPVEIVRVKSIEHHRM